MLFRSPASLTSLPTELLLLIYQDMTYSDIQAFRHTSRHFSAALPKPSNAQLVEAKDSAKSLGQTLLACGGCLRLLPHIRFSTKMLIRRTWATGPYNTLHRETKSPPTNLFGSVTSASSSQSRNHEQFCNKCGSRPLPGPYRYQRGQVWDIEKGLWFLRCPRCGLCEQTSGLLLHEKRRRRDDLCRRCFKLEVKEKREVSKGRRYPSPPNDKTPPVPSMGAITQ